MTTFRINGKISNNEEIKRIIEEAPGYNGEGTYDILKTNSGGYRVYKIMGEKAMDASLNDLPYFTTTEAAAILGVTGSEVRRLLDTGKLEGVKRGRGRGGVWEISAESVERRRAKMTKTYSCYLMNEQGAIFDTEVFTNKEEARKWATGRNGNYTLVIEGEEGKIIEEKKYRD